MVLSDHLSKRDRDGTRTNLKNGQSEFVEAAGGVYHLSSTAPRWNSFCY